MSLGRAASLLELANDHGFADGRTGPDQLWQTAVVSEKSNAALMRDVFHWCGDHRSAYRRIVLQRPSTR